ncbi:ATP-binding protein [Streptomyces odonnellii]|uniref:ATP-binding protein n=1 Tax=Streptomyces odonnellii TaxID=1417980 RepID=UPI0007C776CA|nr:ATP-binding protein [Streptomyces odonnellii]
MTTFTFAPATREQARARIALEGPSGSGKTFTALTLATAMGDSVALIDTERGSASKYARGKSGQGFEFQTLQMHTYDPRDLPKALAAAADARFDVVIVDSLSHFWMGQGGMLELVDAIGKRGGGGGNFGGWKDAKPFERAMIDALLAYPGHVIVTLRTKSEWVVEEDQRTRKKTVRKVGTKAEQREGLEYEFDIVGDLDQENTLVVTKSRCQALSGAVINRPGPDMAATVLEWLNDGESVPDSASLLDEAVSEDLTYAGALALHKRAERYRLLGSAVLHPVTGAPTSLGDVIVERGRQLKSVMAPATAGQTAAAPSRAMEPTTGNQAGQEQPTPAAPQQPPAGPTGDAPVTAPQMRMMHACFTKVGLGAKDDRERRLHATALIIGRQIGSANELTLDEANTLLDTLSNFGDRADPAGDFNAMVQGLLDAQQPAAA